MRELIRNPKFRKALSHAFNRAEVSKGVYFNTGELTTGTYSPKSIEYYINDEGKQTTRRGAIAPSRTTRSWPRACSTRSA